MWNILLVQTYSTCKPDDVAPLIADPPPKKTSHLEKKKTESFVTNYAMYKSILYLAKGSIKKNIESVSMLIPPLDPPPHLLLAP